MSQGFCAHAYELVSEVATCPAENLPPFNVSIGVLKRNSAPVDHQNL